MLAVTDLGGEIVSLDSVKLPSDSQKVIGAILSPVQKMIRAHPRRTFEGIGINVTGRFDPGQEKSIFAPNVAWPIGELKSRVERSTGLPVVVDNVANACALSEVWFGYSDLMHDLVVVNVSEGIGTGIFANGQLLRGANGMAGEFGHVQMETNGPLCGCGGRGCWETVSSNRAGLRYYEEFSGSPAPQSFAALVKMAQDDDVHAIKALQKMSSFMGRGLRMIASALAPSEIVIVGDITTAWYMFGPIIEAELKQNALSKEPRLRPSFEGNTARLRSAVALVMNGSLV